MNLGFTGTRHGMTPAQAAAFLVLVREFKPSQFHHGDCVGADAEAADGVSAVMRKLCRIIVHPPADETHRAFNDKGTLYLTAKTHFARNRDIVNETDVLIATPPYDAEIMPDTRGGTAYTVNYARKQGRPVLIIQPNGRVRRERWPVP